MKNIGIWMDRKEAHIVILENDDEKMETVVSKIEDYRPVGGSRSKTRWGPQDVVQDSKYTERRKHQMKKYFEDLAARIGDAGAIILFPFIFRLFSPFPYPCSWGGPFHRYLRRSMSYSSSWFMGPTCSIVYENEPIEKNVMQQPPRKISHTFLSFKELTISIIQGIIITAGVLLAYQFAFQNGGSEEKTRAMVFCTLILANIFLSFTNRSFFYSVFDSFKNRNSLLAGITFLVLLMLFTILYVKPVSLFFKVTGLSLTEIAVSFLIAVISVLWFEIYKLLKRINTKVTG